MTTYADWSRNLILAEVDQVMSDLLDCEADGSDDMDEVWDVCLVEVASSYDLSRDETDALRFCRK